MNNRGFMGIVMFVVVLLMILFIGFTAVIFAGVADLATDTIAPILDEVADEVITDTPENNMTKVVSQTVNILVIFVDAIPWLITFGYVLALIFSMVFVISYRTNPHPAFIGAYVGLIILLIFGSIIVSNAYEDLYSGNDDIATRLQSNVSMSYLIIYSPMIFALIAFITGIYLFSSSREGGFTV